MTHKHLSHKQQIVFILSLVVFALLMASLACSLTREDVSPTATPTLDVNATLGAATSPAISGVTPPTITILSSSPESPINIGDTLTIRVLIEHEEGATALVLQPIQTNLPPGSTSSIAPVSVALPGDNPSIEETIEWTPDIAGEFAIQITALKGRVPSEPQVIELIVNDPFTGGTPRPTQDLGPCIATVNANGVPLRSAADPNASVIATLSQGTQGEAVGRDRDSSGQGWYYVILSNDPQNREGWIVSSQIDREGGCSNDIIPLRE